MPGIVTRVLAKAGDAIPKVRYLINVKFFDWIQGQTVAVMEAMKMEHQIKAGADIVISEVLVTEKKFVEAGQPLFKLKQE